MKYLLSVFLELLGATAAVTTAAAVPEEDTVGAGTEDGGRFIYKSATAYLILLTSIPEAYSTLSNSF